MESDRIPLLPGKSTPEWAENLLSIFGNNPYGEPRYRFIWSPRKQHFFNEGLEPQYTYMQPQFILEKWTDPMTEAGPEENWDMLTRGLLGPYPRRGFYNYIDAVPDFSEESVRLFVTALQLSRDLTMKQRVDARTENLLKISDAKAAEVAETIVESYDSAAWGKVQQPVTGAKNNFRTPEDYERDMERAIRVKGLPRKGGKLVKEL